MSRQVNIARRAIIEGGTLAKDLRVGDTVNVSTVGGFPAPARIFAISPIKSEGTDMLHLDLEGGRFAIMPASCDVDAERLAHTAYQLGRDVGRAAGAWAADGNTSPEHARRVLAMLDDGDPAADDFLPSQPDLSGEWADDYTPLRLFAQIEDRDAEGEQDANVVDIYSEAFEEGVSETFTLQCEEELRRVVV